MRRSVAVGLLGFCLLAGCGRQQAVPVTNSYSLFGDRYFVDIESEGSTQVTSHVDNRVEGERQVKELAEYKWKGNVLRLDMGRLTFNGKDCGAVKHGDRIRVDKEGRLSVNGEPKP